VIERLLDGGFDEATVRIDAACRSSGPIWRFPSSSRATLTRHQRVTPSWAD
jgi:hypothetical protein